VTDDDRLRRAYQRLMRAYPRWYRQARGLELVTTLLDDAGADQRRPRLVDIVNLVNGGLRARMMPPRCVAAVPLGLLVALSMALVASSAVLLLSPYDGPPTVEQAVTVATIAMAEGANTVVAPPLRCDGGCPRVDCAVGVVMNDVEPMRVDSTSVYFDRRSPDALVVVARAHDRLAAAGWQVGPVTDDGRGASSLTAHSDQFDVAIGTQRDGACSTAAAPSVVVSVSKRVPSLTTAGVVAASVLGLLVGWMTAVSALHRHRRYSRVHQRATISMAMPFLAFAPLVLLFTAQFAALDLADGVSPEDIEAPLAFVEFWWPITVMSVISGLFGLLALALTALPDSGQELPTVDPPYPVRPASR
jgi:hypothetical protein